MLPFSTKNRFTLIEPRVSSEMTIQQIMPKRMIAKPTKAKFTLIELLVVIAIIAILAAMLLPVLGRAKSSAKRVVCTGTLKQWGIAANSHTNDFDGFFPRAYWNGANLIVAAFRDNNDTISWQAGGTTWSTWMEYGLAPALTSCTQPGVYWNMITGWEDGGWVDPYVAGGAGSAQGFVEQQFMYMGGYTGYFSNNTDGTQTNYSKKPPPNKGSDNDMSERALAADMIFYRNDDVYLTSHDTGKAYSYNVWVAQPGFLFQPRYQNILYGDGHVVLQKDFYKDGLIRTGGDMNWSSSWPGFIYHFWEGSPK